MSDETTPDAPDEWTGIGGEYVRDPKTGKRTPKPIETESDPPESLNIEE